MRGPPEVADRGGSAVRPPGPWQQCHYRWSRRDHMAGGHLTDDPTLQTTTYDGRSWLRHGQNDALGRRERDAANGISATRSRGPLRVQADAPCSRHLRHGPIARDGPIHRRMTPRDAPRTTSAPGEGHLPLFLCLGRSATRSDPRTSCSSHTPDDGDDGDVTWDGRGVSRWTRGFGRARMEGGADMFRAAMIETIMLVTASRYRTILDVAVREEKQPDAA